MTELEKYIQTYFGVEENDLSKIVSLFEPIQIKKGEYFQKSGACSNKLAFVQSGILREFIEVEEKEITKWISTHGYFVVDLGSFVFKMPARWNIQAITDCELFVIDSSNYQKIGEVIPIWLVLEKQFITRCFAFLEERI